MGRARYLLAVLALLAVGCDTGEPDARGATVTRFEVRGPVGAVLEQIAVRPARAGERPPLLVFLHGRTDDLDGPDSALSQAMLDGLEELGAAAPAVLLVNGGKASYFHDRAGGDWGTYVLRRAIPAGLRRLRADRSRVAIGGISMGGFGALHLAAPRRFCAVGGHSPASGPTTLSGPRPRSSDAGWASRVRVWRGGHDGDYWDAHMAAYLRFYARALAAC